MRYHFADLPDPRGEHSRRHEPLDVIGIAIGAVISGAEFRTAVEAYARAEHDWLTGVLTRPNGIPSHDTFRRVFCLLDPEAFLRSFIDCDPAVMRVLRLDPLAPPGKAPAAAGRQGRGEAALVEVEKLDECGLGAIGEVTEDLRAAGRP